MKLEHCSRESCVQIIEALQAKIEKIRKDKDQAIKASASIVFEADIEIAAITEERDKVIAELATVQSRLDAYSWEAENNALVEQVEALTKERDASVQAEMENHERIAAAPKSGERK